MKDNGVVDTCGHIFAVFRLNQLARLVKGFTPENVDMCPHVSTCPISVTRGKDGRRYDYV